jgi:hypothetical protein
MFWVVPLLVISIALGNDYIHGKRIFNVKYFWGLLPLAPILIFYFAMDIFRDVKAILFTVYLMLPLSIFLFIYSFRLMKGLNRIVTLVLNVWILLISALAALLFGTITGYLLKK